MHLAVGSSRGYRSGILEHTRQDRAGVGVYGHFRFSGRGLGSRGLSRFNKHHIRRLGSEADHPLQTLSDAADEHYHIRSNKASNDAIQPAPFR